MTQPPSIEEQIKKWRLMLDSVWTSHVYHPDDPNKVPSVGDIRCEFRAAADLVERLVKELEDSLLA